MSNLVPVKVKKLDSNAIIPKYAHYGDAGFDLYTLEDVYISANATSICKTGLAMEIPYGYELQVRPRSGISLKGVSVLCYSKNLDKHSESNIHVRVQLGTVDSNYRGDIGIIVHNPSRFDIVIPKGTRLAQGVLNQVPQADFELVDELDLTDRGEGGFGSTGIK